MLLERLRYGATIAPGTLEESLTVEERRGLAMGIIGYCRSHRMLYRKDMLGQCPVEAMKCEEHGLFLCDGTGRKRGDYHPMLDLPCDEWKGS